MPTYYHLDWKNQLAEEVTIELSHNSSPRWFTDGLSAHGQLYLNGEFQTKIVNLKGQDRFAVNQDIGLEMLWELMRLYEFPDAPSRFQSVFAFESLDAAQQFQALEQRGTIWEVETDQPGFRADMSLLHAVPRTPNARQLAQLYWLQTEDYDRSRLPAECGPPVWEILLAPPVRVVRMVT